MSAAMPNPDGGRREPTTRSQDFFRRTIAGSFAPKGPDRVPQSGLEALRLGRPLQSVAPSSGRPRDEIPKRRRPVPESRRSFPGLGP